MSEKLIVDNFAGIDHIELDVGKINILIGPQTAGKSICAKLLSYFKGFVKEIINSIEQRESKTILDKRFIRRFEEYFPPETWSASGFFVAYESAVTFISIRLESDKKKLRLNYSDCYYRELKKARNKVKKVYTDYQLEHRKERSSDYVKYQAMELSQFDREFYEIKYNILKNLKDHLGITAGYEQYFVPSGRSYFAVIREKMFSLLSKKIEVSDPFLVEFGSFYESFKLAYKRRAHRRQKMRKPLNEILEIILNAKLSYEKDDDYLVQADGRIVNVANSSSGQQEILPLAIVLVEVAFQQFDGQGATIYIEEPEAHFGSSG